MNKPSDTVLKLIEESPLTSIQSLLEALDAENVYKLMSVYGGDTIFIPKIDKILAVARNENIKKDFYSGLSYSQLVAKYGLTNRHIRTILFGGKK